MLAYFSIKISFLILRLNLMHAKLFSTDIFTGKSWMKPIKKSVLNGKTLKLAYAVEIRPKSLTVDTSFNLLQFRRKKPQPRSLDNTNSDCKKMYKDIK